MFFFDCSSNLFDFSYVFIDRRRSSSPFRGAMQNTCVFDDYSSDAVRKKALEDEGYVIGKAFGQGCDCFSDPLLQVLLGLDVIKKPSADVSMAPWRHEACDAVRQHLIHHSDVNLRPRVRDQRS